MPDITAVADAYFAAVTAHDARAVQACFADDAALVNGETVYRGAAAIGDFYRQNLQIDDLRPTPGPYVVDGARLAVEIRLHVVGQDFELADFFTITDGKIARLVIYGLPAAADRAGAARTESS
jgi:ketosteroid isomerase-like protein